VVAVLKHQVQFSLSSEHLNQIHQVWMFQLLDTQCKLGFICVEIYPKKSKTASENVSYLIPNILAFSLPPCFKNK